MSARADGIAIYPGYDFAPICNKIVNSDKYKTIAVLSDKTGKTVKVLPKECIPSTGSKFQTWEINVDDNFIGYVDTFTSRPTLSSDTVNKEYKIVKTNLGLELLPFKEGDKENFNISPSLSIYKGHIKDLSDIVEKINNYKNKNGTNPTKWSDIGIKIVSRRPLPSDDITFFTDYKGATYIFSPHNDIVSVGLFKADSPYSRYSFAFKLDGEKFCILDTRDSKAQEACKYFVGAKNPEQIVADSSVTRFTLPKDFNDSNIPDKE